VLGFAAGLYLRRVRKRRSPHDHGPSELRSRADVSGETAAQRVQLGLRLRELRTRAELTQERAAEAIGLHVKHLQRLERGTVNVTLATLVGVSLAYGVALAELFPGANGSGEPFARLSEADARPYRNAVPLYSLRAVAGRFGGFQQVEPLGWVAPRARTRPAQGLFVARVIGESMDLRIPAGAYCLFRAPPLAPLDGKIVVAQLRGTSDPEHGGEYTIKSYRQLRNGRAAELRPLSRSRRFPPIPVTPEVTVVAELVEVLQA
jgi:transcriptional regulator with XRE-family HTH domain